MRISDWISDVCSSDLVPGHRRTAAPQATDRIQRGEGIAMNAMKLAMPALLATATLLVACQTPAPAPEPAPPPPVVQSQELSTDGLFAFGKSEIADDGVEGRDQSDAFAADLLAGPPYEIVHVIGHSDRIGNADANVALSTRRANSVRDYLLEKGVPADKIGRAHV